MRTKLKNSARKQNERYARVRENCSSFSSAFRDSGSQTASQAKHTANNRSLFMKFIINSVRSALTMLFSLPYDKNGSYELFYKRKRSQFIPNPDQATHLGYSCLCHLHTLSGERLISVNLCKWSTISRAQCLLQATLLFGCVCVQ